jgi:CBS domain containing-hemolysin-like protein
MNDGRSPEDRSAIRNPDETAREPWYERVRQRLGFRARDSIRDELEDALSEAESSGFSPYERAMLKAVLGFHRVRVDDVMVPRADIVAVSADTTLGELLRVFRTAGHSRLPVYGETLDDPRGMIHIRDFLDFLVGKAEVATRRRRRTKDLVAPSLGDVDLGMTLAGARILRPVLFVPPSMPAVDLLVRMQATRTHMALVIDEYGGTDGLVSIEDLVETVVGDIEDEHDESADQFVVKGEGEVYIADARAPLEDVSVAIGVDLSAGDIAEEIDTLGGLIVTLAGRVPSRGELIAGPDNLEFEVLDADPRRLKRVRIHQRADAASAPAAAPGPVSVMPPLSAPAPVPALPAPPSPPSAPAQDAHASPGPPPPRDETPRAAGPGDSPAPTP